MFCTAFGLLVMLKVRTNVLEWMLSGLICGMYACLNKSDDLSG